MNAKIAYYAIPNPTGTAPEAPALPRVIPNGVANTNDVIADIRNGIATTESDGSAEELEPGEYTAALTLNYAVDDGTGVSHLEPLVIENVKFTVSE